MPGPGAYNSDQYHSIQNRANEKYFNQFFSHAQFPHEKNYADINFKSTFHEFKIGNKTNESNVRVKNKENPGPGFYDTKS